MNEEAPTTNRDRALRVLEALLVTSEHPARPWWTKAPWRTVVVMLMPFLLMCTMFFAADFISLRFLAVAPVLACVSLLPRRAWKRAGRLRRKVLPRARSPEVSLPAKLKIPGGFNSRGFVWVGPARVETVLDSGSARNSVDLDFLRRLIQEPTTSMQVAEVVDIEPMDCGSMLENTTFTAKKLAFIDIALKGGPATEGVTKRLGFAVTKRSSDDLIGRPTLCDLGYAPQKESVALRTLGLQFAAVLPSDCHEHVLNSRSATTAWLESGGDSSQMRTLELAVPSEAQSGRWRLEAGPGLPHGVELIEGPLVVTGSRANAILLVSEDCHAGPRMRLGRVRKATREDLRPLATMEAAEAEQHHVQETSERCSAEVNGTLTKRSPKETFSNPSTRRRDPRRGGRRFPRTLNKKSARHGTQSRSL
ncbi:unnamed protein product [Prorocentrum cordatum]|uniref:Uncharacterized protein n=1 Tax=Prorocentrum cordatum TaxID=2364126 RepID=A0ABN9VI95_9DINO|nr:unnamed protein product [Polarella glacialis]